MEESVILSNIAAIIAKDILIDEVNSSQRPKKSQSASQATSVAQYPLLEADDDEALNFYLRQRGLLGETSPETVGAKANAQAKKRTAEQTTGAKDTSFHVKQPPHKRSTTSHSGGEQPLSGRKRFELNLLNSFDAPEFEGHLHMSKMTFLKIFQAVRQFLPATELPPVTPPQTVFSLALWKLATDEHFEQIGRKFKIPYNICQQVIRQFWRYVSVHYESFIQWPNSPQKSEYNMQNFRTQTQLRALDQLLGVVAIKQLDVFFEDENAEVPIILQIICDPDQKVIDCFLELTACYTFDASPIAQTLALNTHALPANSYLIGGSCVPLKSYLMRPFEDASSSSEQRFNEMLEPALRVGQQVLDAMAKRFNILYALEAKDLQEVRQIVETVCALHNQCVDIEDDYVERTHDQIQFEWAKAAAVLKVIDHEENAPGRQRRAALMAKIVEIASVS